MREMKESGIEWIGKIPTNWKVSKIKYVINKLYSGGTPQSGNPLFYDNNGFCWVAIGDMSTTSFVKDTKSHITLEGVLDKRLKLVKKGTILYSIYATIGKVSQLNVDSYINQAILALYPNETENNTFFKYWLSSLESYALSECSLNIQNNLNAEKVKNFPYLLTSFNNQQKIVTYLDNKCQEIDYLTSDIQKQIETLQEYKKSIITEAVTKGLDPNVEMKDSGIEWIGKIPKEWHTNKMSRICTTITDYVASGSFADVAKNVTYLDEPDYAMLIRTVDISGKKNSVKPIFINEHSYNFLNNSNLFGGEIILPNIGASVGDDYIVPKLYKKMSLAPNSIMFKTNQVDKYYYYVFASAKGRKTLIDISSSSAQAKFNKTELRQLRLPQPDIKEQQTIADFLDNKCEEIDTIITTKKEQLEILVECKKSLIYEYVTGKKEVPYENN